MFSEKLLEIIHKAVMSTRSSFYSGRGVNYGDVSSKHFLSICENIQKIFGQKAEKGFVEMNRNVPVLSASEFLQALEILECNCWDWDKSNEKHLQPVPADKDNPVGTIIGIILFNSNKESRRDQEKSSNYLKCDFLKKKLTKNRFKKWKEEVGLVNYEY